MADPPNVLVVTTHDTGRHLGCYGVETVHTPNVDRLAAEGLRFTDYFAAAPQCSPSRGAMLTGRYPQSNGLVGLTNEPWGWRLDDDAVHLAERLAGAGYHTALFGIQHEAPDAEELGFETVREGARPGPAVAEDVATFLADAPEPFYAQVGLFETHEPLDFGGAEPDDARGVHVPPYLADTPATRSYLAQFQGLVRQMDAAVGAVDDALADAGLREGTLVAFTSDHGIPFSRAKGYLYDAGIGVPLVLRWPGGGVAGGTCDWLTSNVDFVPTLLEVLGLKLPEDVEGTSFAAALDGDGAPAPGDGPREAVFAAFHDHREWGFGPDARCVRTREQKLVRNFAPDTRFDPPVDLGALGRLGRSGLKSGGPRPPVELYDLGADPNEFENLADDPGYEGDRERLDDRLWAWLESVEDPLLAGPPRTPFYERAMADRGGR